MILIAYKELRILLLRLDNTRIERLSAQSGSLRLNVHDQDSWHSELVIVIDDVVTTGSTISESVRAFRESSINVCYAITIFAA